MGVLPGALPVKIGLMIYGRLDTLTGGYRYDRQMVAALEGGGTGWRW
jgi:hypothetical protein